MRYTIKNTLTIFITIAIFLCSCVSPTERKRRNDLFHYQKNFERADSKYGIMYSSDGIITIKIIFALQNAKKYPFFVSATIIHYTERSEIWFCWLAENNDIQGFNIYDVNGLLIKSLDIPPIFHEANHNQSETSLVNFCMFTETDFPEIKNLINNRTKWMAELFPVFDTGKVKLDLVDFKFGKVSQNLEDSGSLTHETVGVGGGF